MQKNREQLMQNIITALQGLNLDGLELISSCFIPPLQNNERYSADTTGDRLKELKADIERMNKEYRQEREAKELKRKSFESIFLYDRNTTMRILGHNCYWQYVSSSDNGAYSNGFKDIISAHRYNTDIMQLLTDVFSYGMICGIKEQRKRRQSK